MGIDTVNRVLEGECAFLLNTTVGDNTYSLVRIGEHFTARLCPSACRHQEARSTQLQRTETAPTGTLEAGVTKEQKNP